MLPTEYVSYWFIGGLIHLFILSYQDIKNNHTIDDRYNYMMYGFTAGFYFLIRPKLIFIIGCIISAILLYFILKKAKFIGDGDLNAFNWIIIGLGIISFDSVITFLICLIVLCILLVIFRLLNKKDIHVAFFPYIFISFLVTGLWNKLLF